MAKTLKSESFENAIINMGDMTITEYEDDSVRCYSLREFLKRWDGVVGVTLSIQRSTLTPPDGREDW